MKNVMKVAILSLLVIVNLWFLGSTLFVKAQIANSPEAYIFDKSNTPIVVIAPIKGELASTFYSTTYSKRTGNSGYKEGTSAFYFERTIFPLTNNENVKEFIFLLNSNSDNGVAAEEISRVIKQIPQPTTVIIQGEVGKASYIIASGADRIVIERNATIKNIGDVELVVNRKDYGTIERECATSTNNLITLTQNGCTSFLDEEQINSLRTYVLERTTIQYEIISLNRNLSIQKLKSLANKEIPSQSALNEGLVDEIGSQKEVLDSIKTQIGNFRILNYGDILR